MALALLGTMGGFPLKAWLYVQNSGEHGTRDSSSQGVPSIFSHPRVKSAHSGVREEGSTKTTIKSSSALFK